MTVEIFIFHEKGRTMKVHIWKFQITLLTMLLAATTPQYAVDNATYVDPTIGNVSRLLVPTFPTYHLPNQMIRMFPISKDYIDDQVTAFPLQVVCHRDAGIMRLGVSVGELTSDTWKQRMTYDHDLETRHPWLFSTLLDELDVTLSFAPGEKCAIYKVAFPEADQKHLLIQGSRSLQVKVLNANAFALEEPFKYTTRGIDRVLSLIHI